MNERQRSPQTSAAPVPGVTIAVCCLNSARRLPATLSHLVKQRVPADIHWEVLVIDNGSSDNTADVARNGWPVEASAPLRVIEEPRAGLSHARARAFREARYAFVSFVDDDNWVCEDWVALAAKTMAEHPGVAICGGLSEPVFDAPPPPWFEQFSASFAIGAQAETRGECQLLWGAGMTVRKAAWEQLSRSGFLPVLAGRQGGRLTAGEDSELCLAMRLAGWKLWYEPDLKFRHYIPPERIQWDHLRKLYRGFGAARVYLPLYKGWPEDSAWTLTARKTWLSRFEFVLRDLFGRRRLLFSFNRNAREGDPEVLYFEWSIGFLRALLRSGLVYRKNARMIRDLPVALNAVSQINGSPV
jgi:glycosyltransferase involved in cell wall biosynthesis